MVTLNKPSAGDTDWTTEINDNWTTIEENLAVDIGCRCTGDSTEQAISTGTTTAIVFDGTDRYDSDNMHDPASDNTQIKINTSGKYIVGGNVRWASNATGHRQLRIRLNGTTDIASQHATPVATTWHMNVSCVYDFVDTDYIELTVFQDSGGNLNVTKSNNVSPEFWAQRISS